MPRTRDNHRTFQSPSLPHPRFSDELIEEARVLFQKRTDRVLTSEDGRQMLENLTGYFTTLVNMERQQKALSRLAEDFADNSVAQVAPKTTPKSESAAQGKAASSGRKQTKRTTRKRQELNQAKV